MECKSILCVKHGPLIGLDRHAHNIARFFIYENFYDEELISPWFRIASGIENVKYYSDKYDPFVQWCGTAIDYENAKSSFHSKLIKSLTFFNFIWGGFEAYVDTLEIEDCPKYKGKINKVNFFLKNNYLNHYEIPDKYNEVLDVLKKMIKLNPWYDKKNDLCSVNSCESEELLGLKIVYKIRNLFAHGAFTFSEPEGWHHTKPLDYEIICASSRIVLLTIQMLLLSNSNTNFKVPQLHETDDHGINAGKFAMKMHLKSFKHS